MKIAGLGWQLHAVLWRTGAARDSPLGSRLAGKPSPLCTFQADIIMPIKQRIISEPTFFHCPTATPQFATKRLTVLHRRAHKAALNAERAADRLDVAIASDRCFRIAADLQKAGQLPPRTALRLKRLLKEEARAFAGPHPTDRALPLVQTLAKFEKELLTLAGQQEIVSALLTQLSDEG